MKKTLSLLSQGFESSSYKTEEFKAFYRTFKSELTKELKSIGATDIRFSIGHFDVNGFFTSPNGQIYYFSLSDVRGMEFMNSDRIRLMYRTAKHHTDWTGGGNQWVKIESGMANKMSIQ